MLNKLGHKNFTLLARMMDLLSAKQRVHAQNIANVNTPNYRRRELRFDRALQQAMDKGTAEAYSTMQGWVDRPRNTPVRNNGNNVDIDLEMVAMGENSNLYEVYTDIYNRKSAMLKTAITKVG
jgi:flagellar basal-body rod protein FlgB